MADVCPECGTPLDHRSVPPARWTSARRLVPLLLVLVAAGIVIVLSYRTSVVWPPPAGGWDEPTPSRAVGDGFTWADIKAIHDGAADSRLTLDILETLWHRRPFPREGVLYARFLPPSGVVESRIGIGWPTPWVTRIQNTQYRNAPQRLDVVPKVWGDYREKLWGNGFVMTFPGPDDRVQATRVGYNTRLGGISLTIVLLVAGVAACGAFMRLAKHSWTPRRRIVIIGVLLGLVAMLSAARIDRAAFTSLSELTTNDAEITARWPSEEPAPGIDLGLVG